MIHRSDLNRLLQDKNVSRIAFIKHVFSIAVVMIIIKVIHWLLAHETIFKITEKRRNDIKKNGLVHYTTKEKARIILEQNRIVGNLDYKSTFPSHRQDSLVWFLSNNRSIIDGVCRWCVLRRHSPTRKNIANHRVKYEVKLLISNFSDEYISKMKINIEGGIGCYVRNIEGVSISYADLDTIDKVLGVMDINDYRNR